MQIKGHNRLHVKSWSTQTQPNCICLACIDNCYYLFLINWCHSWLTGHNVHTVLTWRLHLRRRHQQQTIDRHWPHGLPWSAHATEHSVTQTLHTHTQLKWRLQLLTMFLTLCLSSLQQLIVTWSTRTQLSSSSSSICCEYECSKERYILGWSLKQQSDEETGFDFRRNTISQLTHNWCKKICIDDNVISSSTCTKNPGTQ